ncbi:MAG: Gfo/Idh/MocA family oxidoreductase [Candidatus Sulfotelmatobacter sp.]
MRSFFFLTFLLFAFHALPPELCQNAPAANRTPLRVGIVGLVHGHVQGFLDQSLHNPEIEIVGIAEPDQSLSTRYAKQYNFDRALLFANLDEMLDRTHPQAVLVYTNTYDHRRVVETCARHGVHVMMEKPLAVSLTDALAIKKAADAARIQVLVNYEDNLVPQQSRRLRSCQGKRAG